MRKNNPKIIYRVRALRAMDAFIDAIGDEKTLETWLTDGLPLSVKDDDDFYFIAGDDETFEKVTALFKSIVKDVQA